MKNVKKRIAMLMAAMVLCLSMEIPSVMEAKAAECEAMSARLWTHCGCNVPVVVSVKKMVDVKTKEKCREYNHGPSCYIYSGYFYDAYVITCPQCGISEIQNTGSRVFKSGVHLED